MQARRFAITFFSKPDIEFKEPIRYIIAGEEKCPSTGRIHWQSYIELTKRFRLKALKALIGDSTAHIEAAKGNSQQNIDYCSKEGNVILCEGVPAQKVQGQRNDIIALRDHFKVSKKRTHDALDDDDLLPVVARYPKLCNMLELHYSVPRSEMTELFIYWGCTGSGKSHTAYEEAKQFGAVYFKPSGQWWDGYEGQPSVIFEDFRGETGLAPLLRIVDKYPLRVPVKGGFKEFVSSRLYITSNVDIDDWFNVEQRGYEPSMSALRRRVTKKVHFDIPFQN